MAGATRITLPAPSRPTGGLLSAARPLDGEWWRGVTFSSGQCTVPQVVGTACVEENTEKESQRPGDAVTFEAFGVVASIDCTTMGRSDVATYAEQTLEATREFAVAREFLTGASSSVSPSLSDATDLGAVADPVAALGCLDQRAANALSGRLAFIHASPAIANVWMAESAIRLDGRTWRTALGSVVVVSPGYDGRAPGSASAAPTDGESLYAYATGEVYAAYGQRETMDAVDRSINTRIAHSEEVALVAFDPCFVVALDVGVTYCELAS